MSAQELRQAAALMRERFEREDVDDVAEATFYLAVADWLDGVALLVEAKDDEEYFDLDGDPIAPEDTHAIGSALAVARAYLGAES